MLSHQYMSLRSLMLDLDRPIITAEAMLCDFRGQPQKGDTTSTWLFFGILAFGALSCQVRILGLPWCEEAQAIWGGHVCTFWHRAPVQVPANNSVNCQVEIPTDGSCSPSLSYLQPPESPQQRPPPLQSKANPLWPILILYPQKVWTIIKMIVVLINL